MAARDIVATLIAQRVNEHFNYCNSDRRFPKCFPVSLKNRLHGHVVVVPSLPRARGADVSIFRETLRAAPETLDDIA